MKDLNQEIQDLYQELKQKEKIEIHLGHLKQLIDQYAKDIKALDLKLQKEAYDIQRLEKLNLHALFHRILGNKEEQLEKERQEIVNAINIANNLLDKLTRLISMLEQEIKKTREFVKIDNKERRRLLVESDGI